MKKTKWILVVVILLIAAPSYAKSGAVKELKFKDIEKLMMDRNPTIQINKNIKKNLKDGIDAIEDVEDDRDDLEDSIDDIKDAIDSMYSAIDKQDELIINLQESLVAVEGDNRLDEDPAPSDGGNPEDEPIEGQRDDSNEEGLPSQGEIPGNGLLYDMPDPLVYQTLIGTIKHVQGLYEMNIEMLENNIDMMEEQLDEFEKLPGQIMELEKTILQLDMANETIILGAQNLYLGYNNLSRQMEELVQNLENLENRIELMLIQEELGMVRTMDVGVAVNQREQLKLAIQTMQTQLDNILGEINLMLDQDFDNSLELVDSTISLDVAIVDQSDYKDDLKRAKKNSYAINLKDYDYDIKEHNAWWVDRYGSSSDSRIADRDLDNVKIEQDQEDKKVELVFDKAYKNLKDKRILLENERKNFEILEKEYELLEIRYELGMVSTIEYNQGQADYNADTNSLATSEQNLFQAWLAYDALVQGINFQQ